MIGVVTALAAAICRHCDGRIMLCQADYEVRPHWVHDENGLQTCPGVPVAEPRSATQQPVT